MQLQTVNRSDAEKVFVNVTNVGGQTATNNQPVFAFTAAQNLASVGSNNNVTSIKRTVTSAGSFIGLADEDIVNNAVGRVQVYGYKASCQVAGRGSAGVEHAGTCWGPPADIASLGLTSFGYGGIHGPVVVLDTVVAATMQLNGTGHANHVFIRNL
jgi:hypothetical protein